MRITDVGIASRSAGKHDNLALFARGGNGCAHTLETLGERVPDVPERLRVVVHHEDALPLPLRPLPAGGEPGNAGCGIPGHRNREGEPRPQARPVALGPYPAPVGLPDDYAERGRGFDGMRADAEQLGGALIVESGEGGGGTTIACVVPYEADQGGG